MSWPVYIIAAILVLCGAYLSVSRWSTLRHSRVAPEQGVWITVGAVCFVLLFWSVVLPSLGSASIHVGQFDTPTLREASGLGALVWLLIAVFSL